MKSSNIRTFDDWLNSIPHYVMRCGLASGSGSISCPHTRTRLRLSCTGCEHAVEHRVIP